MIARISHGNGFRGVCSYLLREGREDDLGWEAYRLDTNMSGHNARQLAHEFGMYRQINGRVENPVFHASLRLPNGESLTDEQWRAVASMYLQQMGYTNTAYVVIKHPENHIHIVASRIRFDGTRVQTWQERWTSMGAMHEIERAYDLSRPRTRPSKEHPSRLVRESPVEQRMAAQLGERPVKVELARRIDMALERSDGSREDFTRALAEAGVQVRWSAGKDGTVRGASFELSEYSGQQQARWKGSKIGSLYRWQELGARLEEHAQAHAIRQEQAAERAAESERAAEPERETLQAERSPAATVELTRAYQELVRQQWRVVGFLGERGVVFAAATELARAHPELDMVELTSAVEAARPGSIERLPGGWDLLWKGMDDALRQARDDQARQLEQQARATQPTQVETGYRSEPDYGHWDR